MTNQIHDILLRIERRLSESKTVLTFEEAANYLGLSASHLYKLTSTNALPFSKPGGKLIFFERLDLDAWAMRNRIRSAEETDDAASRMLLRRR